MVSFLRLKVQRVTTVVFFVNRTGFEPTTPTTTNLKILRIKAETNCLSWRIFVPESDLNPFARSRLNPVSAGINQNSEKTEKLGNSRRTILLHKKRQAALKLFVFNNAGSNPKCANVLIVVFFENFDYADVPSFLQ